MHYPIERISYRDARHATPREFRPLEDLLIIDTSALGFPYSHLLCDFMNKGGTIIMPSTVHKEVAELDANRPSVKSPDTAKRLRIPLNGKALVAEATAKKRQIIANLPDDSDARSQLKLCEALAGILPKRHAYFLTREYHRHWYQTLGEAVDHHQESGKGINIEDIRNHESGAYRILNLIMRPEDNMPAELRLKLAKIHDDINLAQDKYQQVMEKTLGPTALDRACGDATVATRHKRAFKDDTHTILLRLLGYHLEGGPRKSEAYVADGLARRFEPRPITESADASCVALSYVLELEQRRRRVVYASDRDIAQLLELRKVCHEHADVRRHVYRELHLQRESQRLPRQT